MIEILGLKACDTCKKSLKAIIAAGKDAQLIDIRDAPLSSDMLREYLNLFGEALVNKRSTTWRQLGEDEQNRPALDLLVEFPALMKRPVIRDQDRVTLGWSKVEQDIWLS